MTELTKEHTEDILREMCRRIRATLEEIDTTKADWFMEYTWTSMEERDFINWLAEFFEKNKYVRKQKRSSGVTQAQHEAMKFDMQYGWRTKD